MDSQYNTAIVAAAEESFVSTKEERGLYAPFNFLFISNRSAVAIKIMLDGLETDGKFYEMKSGDTLILNPEDDESFSFIKQLNLDAVSAEVADKILVKWGRKVKEGD